MIYDGGLRISEVLNLRTSDVDLDRMMIHVRESKCKRDRYVPISPLLVMGIQSYYTSCHPENCLFNGKVKGDKMSKEGIRHAFRSALKKSKINKKACVHTLRHSYATHLMEFGLDIVSIRNQMGHVDIATTMMYVHIARISPEIGFSPMSKLYET